MQDLKLVPILEKFYSSQNLMSGRTENPVINLGLERINSANLYDAMDDNSNLDFSNRQLLKKMNIGEVFQSKTEVDEYSREDKRNHSAVSEDEIIEQNFYNH